MGICGEFELCCRARLRGKKAVDEPLQFRAHIGGNGVVIPVCKPELAGLAEEMRMEGDLDAPHHDVTVTGATIDKEPFAPSPLWSVRNRTAGMDPNGAKG